MVSKVRGDYDQFKQEADDWRQSYKRAVWGKEKAEKDYQDAVDKYGQLQTAGSEVTAATGRLDSAQRRLNDFLGWRPNSVTDTESTSGEPTTTATTTATSPVGSWVNTQAPNEGVLFQSNGRWLVTSNGQPRHPGDFQYQYQQWRMRGNVLEYTYNGWDQKDIYRITGSKMVRVYDDGSTSDKDVFERR